ncbi:uncharacterized protein A4U43_C03F21890, partial [Asparagus officinalis]
MEGVDKERVQRIVYEMSKGSKYFESEKRKEAFIQQKVENLRAQREKLTDKDIAHFQEIADKKIVELEASRDLTKVWLHSDMDAFYAAVETLEDPSLKGKALAVGSLSMICTASYEARKFGVRAAMPGFIACKLCPDLVFVPPKFEKYTYYSELTRKIFQKYDPDFIATSLDEAYLNITDTCVKRGISGEEVADELRKAIFEEAGLTCSAGVAPNRMLAKVCSDINKPNGQFILTNDRKAVMTFISSLPIRKVGGIGKVTEQVLRDVLGISTCEDMLQKGSLLCALFSPCSTDFFLSVGLGLGGTETPRCRSRKSISSERTFSATGDESFLFQKLADLAENLSKDMQKESLCGRTLTLKLKTATFEGKRFANVENSTGSLMNDRHVMLEGELKFSTGDSNCFSNDGYSNVPYEPDIMTESNQLMQPANNSGTKEYGTYSFDDACPTESRTTTMEKFKRGSNSAEDKAVLSCCHKPLVWVDDYICSVCGIELPPSFIAERQEHFDYHLAQMLQEEETVNNRSQLDQRESFSQKGKKNVDSRKKHKSSPKEDKHIPIDAFFIKSKKNM